MYFYRHQTMYSYTWFEKYEKKDYQCVKYLRILPIFSYKTLFFSFKCVKILLAKAYLSSLLHSINMNAIRLQKNKTLKIRIITFNFHKHHKNKKR